MTTDRNARDVVIDYKAYAEFLERILAEGAKWPQWRKTLFGGAKVIPKEPK